MGYQEKVAENIDASGQRSGERKALWVALASAFEQEGPDAIERYLGNLLDPIQEKFDSKLDKLNKML